MRVALVVAMSLAAVGAVGAEEEERAANDEFNRLETGLLGASQLREQERLQEMVAPDFAYRLSFADRADYVLNRSEWFRGSEYYDLKNFEISRLAAQVFGQTSVVTFQLVTSAELGGRHDLSGPYFVTDVWTGGAGKWKLTRRFVSRPATTPAKR